MSNVTSSAALGGPSRPTARGGRRRLTLVVVAVIAVLALLVTGGSWAYAKQFEGRALPGTTLLGQDVAGQTPEEIASLVSDRAAGVTVSVTAGDQQLDVPLADLGVGVDAEATAQAALDRDASLPEVLASTWSGEHPVEPVVTVDEAAVTAFAQSLVPEDRAQPVDAQVLYDEEQETWSTTPGQPGQGVDAQQLVQTVTQEAPALESFAVEQEMTDLAPAITTEEADAVLAHITGVLEQPMSITGAEDEVHEISAERRSQWLSVGPDESGQALALTVDEQAVRDWVADRAEKDAVEPENGIEQVDQTGAVVKVVAEKQDGLEITNSDAVADQLIATLQGPAPSPLEAAFETQGVASTVEQVEAPADEETAAPGEEEPAAGEATPAAPTGEKWIDVDLSAKTVTAYVGDTVVWGPRPMVDGKSGNETVTGTYEIYLRYEEQDMTNASRYPVGHEKYYFTEDVPWVQYFHNGYGFHGAPWRSSFGFSGSHGCINMPVHEAKWLWDWASIGTKVVSHY